MAYQTNSLITTYRIEDFITQGSTSSVINYDKLLLKDKNENGEIVGIYNLINDYYNELMESSVIAVMDDKLYEKFKYKPRLLSYYLYGTTDLFFLLLLLNGISSVKQFNFKKVRIVRKESISEVISYIYSSEQKNIINNRAKL